MIRVNGKMDYSGLKQTIKYFDVNIAGINIEIECLYGTEFGACKPYLSDFEAPDILVTTTMEDIYRELSIYPRFEFPRFETNKENIAITYDYANVEPLAVQRKIANSLPIFNTFLMHGSVVAVNGKAYMFTASSGTGKTTRANIWVNDYPGSIIVNGDKPYIKIEKDEVFACGTPWCGKEGMNTNAIVPLKGIFMLERAAQNEKDTIQEVGLTRALPFLLKQTFIPEGNDALKKTISLLLQMEQRVKLYKFRSKPTSEAIRLAYETVTQKR